MPKLKFKVGDIVEYVLADKPLFKGKIILAKPSKVNKTYTIDVDGTKQYSDSEFLRLCVG